MDAEMKEYRTGINDGKRAKQRAGLAAVCRYH